MGTNAFAKEEKRFLTAHGFSPSEGGTSWARQMGEACLMAWPGGDFAYLSTPEGNPHRVRAAGASFSELTGALFKAAFSDDEREALSRAGFKVSNDGTRSWLEAERGGERLTVRGEPEASFLLGAEGLGALRSVGKDGERLDGEMFSGVEDLVERAVPALCSRRSVDRLGGPGKGASLRMHEGAARVLCSAGFNTVFDEAGSRWESETEMGRVVVTTLTGTAYVGAPDEKLRLDWFSPRARMRARVECRGVADAVDALSSVRRAEASIRACQEFSETRFDPISKASSDLLSEERRKGFEISI